MAAGSRWTGLHLRGLAEKPPLIHVQYSLSTLTHSAQPSSVLMRFHWLLSCLRGEHVQLTARGLPAAVCARQKTAAGRLSSVRVCTPAECAWIAMTCLPRPSASCVRSKYGACPVNRVGPSALRSPSM